MITDTLPVKLTDREVMDRGAELAATFDEIATEALQFKEFAASAKARVKSLEAKVDRLVKAIRRREEDREVELLEISDWDSRRVSIRRADTGEEVSSRAMTEEELQKPLPFRIPDDPGEVPESS